MMVIDCDSNPYKAVTTDSVIPNNKHWSVENMNTKSERDKMIDILIYR